MWVDEGGEEGVSLQVVKLRIGAEGQKLLFFAKFADFAALNQQGGWGAVRLHGDDGAAEINGFVHGVLLTIHIKTEYIQFGTKSVWSSYREIMAPVWTWLGKFVNILGGDIHSLGSLGPVAPRGHPRQRKNPSLEVWKPLRRIFRAYPLWHTKIGGSGSPRRVLPPFIRIKGSAGGVRGWQEGPSSLRGAGALGALHIHCLCLV